MATINSGITINPPFGGQRCDLDRMDVPVANTTSEKAAAYLLRNWFKRDGKFALRPGWAAVGTSLSDRALGIIQYDHQNGQHYTVIGTESKWFYYNIGTKDWEDITGSALHGAESTHMVFRAFCKNATTYLVGINGYNDNPMCWNGVAATFSAVGGSPPKAFCMAICNNRMLLGNTYTTQANPQQIDVSAFNNFEAGWGATQTINLADTPGDIVAMRESGNLAVVIYKTDSIYRITAQGGTDPFAAEMIVQDSKGPVSDRALISTPNGHVFMARDGSFWLLNANGLTPLGAHLQAHVRQTADLGMISRSFGFFDAIHNEVWFVYRGSGAADPNMGLVIDMSDLTAWPISFTTLRPTAGYGVQLMQSPIIGDLYMPLGDLTTAIADWSHLYNRNILVDSAGQVADDTGVDDLGVPIPWEIETGMVYPASTPGQLTTITESEHYFAGTSSLDVQLGYSKHGEDPQYSTVKTSSVGSVQCVLGHRLTARAFSLKLAGASSYPLQWRKSVVYGVPRGLK